MFLICPKNIAPTQYVATYRQSYYIRSLSEHLPGDFITLLFTHVEPFLPKNQCFQCKISKRFTDFRPGLNSRKLLVPNHSYGINGG